MIAALVEDAHALNNAAAAPSGALDFVRLDEIFRAIMRRGALHASISIGKEMSSKVRDKLSA
jgi:hypothetical protein